MDFTKIKRTFLDFFVSKNHIIIPSSSLIPSNDQTLLFTNSGMVQFKDVFLGIKKLSSSRVTTSQRCIRAGGKHNDLENVGYTARHHTFFEMLGNFSFGDYFKYEAIHYAWELLTNIYKLPKEKLLITVYKDDDESFDIWKSDIGISSDRLISIGDDNIRYNSDNFWQMDNTGPCGPCSEIFYQSNSNLDKDYSILINEKIDNNYIEIWNLVFMQFNRNIDGNLSLLPQKSVDTGMGLERISSVIQNVDNNYEIDLFKILIKSIANETSTDDLKNNSLKVIADHIRASAFLIIDGVFPGNEGRNYVLRRIIRRAIRHGYKLGCKKPFLYKLVTKLIIATNEIYPELKDKENYIKNLLHKEEDQFFETIGNGISILDKKISEERKKNKNIIDGNLAFKLHDTYGFPIDITLDICKENNFIVDIKNFNKKMISQKEQGRLSNKFYLNQIIKFYKKETIFHGYELTFYKNSKIIGLYVNSEEVKKIKLNQYALIILDNTTFYPESGGQVGDQGTLYNLESKFYVIDTKKINGNIIAHYGNLVEGELKVGDVINSHVYAEKRLNISRNHSAAHILHDVLKKVIGEHIYQKGSLIDDKKIRFDFSSTTAISEDEICSIETNVNSKILMNVESKIFFMTYEDAIKKGSIALFEDKYTTDLVRVVDIGSSSELCCGTHINYTGDIGFFKIIKEYSISSGVRRIEAVTGHNALNYVQEINKYIKNISIYLKTSYDKLLKNVTFLQNRSKNLEKELKLIKSEIINYQFNLLIKKIINVNNIKIIISSVELADIEHLKKIIYKLKKFKISIIVLASVKDNKIIVISSVIEEINKKIKANDLINFILPKIGGKGGGKANLAQAIGFNYKSLDSILLNIIEWIKEKI